MSIILGIESSCDETAAAVTRDGKLLASVISSQADIHAKYGGVMPEVASRLHVENIGVVLKETMEKAGIGYEDIERSGIFAPLYDLKIRYYAPLEINDVAIIHTRYVYKPGARLDYHYAIYRERDNQLCAEGETTQLFIDANGQLMVDKPAYYQDWQTRYYLAMPYRQENIRN